MNGTDAGHSTRWRTVGSLFLVLLALTFGACITLLGGFVLRASEPRTLTFNAPQKRVASWPCAVPDDWPAPNSRRSLAYFGKTRAVYAAESPMFPLHLAITNRSPYEGSETHWVVEQTFGLPLPCLRQVTWLPPAATASHVLHQYCGVSQLTADGESTRTRSNAFRREVKPMWGGMIFNSFAFAALFGYATLLVARRFTFRRRSGLDPYE